MTEDKYKGKVLNFMALLEKNSIEVPIIQRDYAQGRYEEQEIRRRFLDALYESLESNTKIMLDFIYGSVVSDCFQPLDGQQRLTTLFLLYWYAANLDKKIDDYKGLLSHFTYETRITSRDFCNALVKNPIEIYKNIAPSTTIIDSSWFFLSWKKDPTVNAMLRTLDDIHEIFFSVKNLWDKLSSNHNSLINFYHVELENIGLTDDLYIKMNARGKLLTSFENFKAGLEKTIKENSWEDKSDFTNSFSCKIDTVWADFFWNNFRKSDQIDDPFMRFISTILMIRLSLKKTNVWDRNAQISSLQESPNTVNPLMFDEADFQYLVECLDLYTNHYDTIKTIELGYPLWRHTPDKDFLSDIVTKESGGSYTAKVLFYAQTEYFRRNKYFEPERYKEWIRIIRNTISRGDIDVSGKRPDIVRSPYGFDGVIKLVSELSEGCADIYKYLRTQDRLKSTFAKDQIEEEQLKARLIHENFNRKEIIYRIEDTDLLRGKIAFALYCIDYTNHTKSFDDKKFIDVEKVITCYFKDECEITNDFRRALLTIEFANKYEYYNYWWSFWNVDSTNKRCLIDKFREIEYYIYSDYKGYFKQLVIKLITDTLENIPRSFVPPRSFPNWKIRLIKESDLFDKHNKSNYIAIPDDDSYCYLLKSKRPRDAEGSFKVI